MVLIITTNTVETSHIHPSTINPSALTLGKCYLPPPTSITSIGCMIQGLVAIRNERLSRSKDHNDPQHSPCKGRPSHKGMGI